ncbi:MAG: phosphotransferase [Candidatus Uhrbacteria bacterium]
MKNEFERAIERAYASKLRVEHRGGKAVILKSVAAQERKNELAFHTLLAELGMPNMQVAEEGNDLVVDFIADAETLGDEETPERYEQLGRSLRILHFREYPNPFIVERDGTRRELDWNTFLNQQVQYGIARQKEREGLGQDLIKRIVAVISVGAKPERITPIHGDLHANNVLLKNDNLYLFDKADNIFSGDPLYDLALFGITLPGIYGVGSEVVHDQRLAQALIAGYGSDFLSDRDTFDRYVLLRAIERWPNPFEKEIPELVQVILGRFK